MDSKSLSVEQLTKLQRQITGQVCFLRRLVSRMVEKRFPATDLLGLRTAMLLDQAEAMQRFLEFIVADRREFEQKLLNAKSGREYKQILKNRPPR